MSKRILQKIATQTRTVSYKFNDQFLFDSIPICSLSMTEAKVAFDIMKTGDFISTASLIKLFGRKGVVMESGIKRFVRERTGSEENDLEFDDFHKLVTSKEDMCEDGLTIRDVFNVFDSDSDAVITHEELCVWMVQHGKLMTIDDIKNGTKSHDRNDDGVIDRSEFVQMVTKKILLTQLRENHYA